MTEEKPQSKLFARFFWGTIIVLAVVSLALVGLGLWRSAHSPGHEQGSATDAEAELATLELVIEGSVLQQIFANAADIAAARTSGMIEQKLEDLYGPVYTGIVTYSDFHYTVLGQYTELFGAALGTAAEAIEGKLFSSFSERLDRIGFMLDERFADEFRIALTEELEAEVPEALRDAPLSPMTQRAIDDALSRVRVTVPVGTVMASIGGATAIKAVSAAIAAKVATKVAATAAAKGVVKGGGILGGAGLGALGGSWAGPVGAVAGGIIGGAVTWFAVDATVISIDQYFNRDDFEADLRAMVDEHREVVREHLSRAIEQKSEDMKSFSLRELAAE